MQRIVHIISVGTWPRGLTNLLTNWPLDLTIDPFLTLTWLPWKASQVKWVLTWLSMKRFNGCKLCVSTECTGSWASFGSYIPLVWTLGYIHPFNPIRSVTCYFPVGFASTLTLTRPPDVSQDLPNNLVDLNIDLTLWRSSQNLFTLP
jgi:hypothetical protein